MTRVRGAARLFLAVGALAVLGAGGADARDIQVKRKVAATTANAPEAAPEKAEQAAPAVAAIVVPACARKVKVIYAGYGEAGRASCDVAAAPVATVTATR